MEAIDILKSRRSIRSYTDQMPADDDIAAIVEVAQHAPNAGKFHTTVLTDRALLDEMDEANYQAMIGSGSGFGFERASLPGYRPYYHAPVCIIFSTAEGDPLGPVNAACACTAGAYAATALGLGSCYVMGPAVSMKTVENLPGKLRLPEGYACQCALLVGYTDDSERFAVASSQEPADYI